MEKKSGFKSVNATNIVPFDQSIKPAELFDYQIEQMVLGSILENNLKFEQAASYISSDSFYYSIHGKIWDEIKKKIDNGEKASIISLNPIFKDSEELKERGGADYLVALVADLIAPDIEECSKIVRDFALRRTMLDAVLNAAESIKTNPSIYQSLTPLENAIQSVSEQTGDVFENGQNSWYRTKEKIEAVRNGAIFTVPSGFNPLDDILLGFQNGCLYVVAGATGMGKTALALNIAENVIDDGKVLLFSMEMSQEQLNMRRAANSLGITIKQQLKSKDLTDSEMRSISNFYINPNLIVIEGGKDISTLANISKKFARKFPDAKMIVVDYLQLMTGNPKILQKVYQIEEITRGLKRLAMALNLPIILVSQLSRSVAGREDKRPVLSDLKDSSSIEQDADSVIFVYRNEYYLSREKPIKGASEPDSKYNDRLVLWQQNLESEKGKAEIIIDKNRYGETGTAVLKWEGRKMKFSDFDRQESLF